MALGLKGFNSLYLLGKFGLQANDVLLAVGEHLVEICLEVAAVAFVQPVHKAFKRLVSDVLVLGVVSNKLLSKSLLILPFEVLLHRLEIFRLLGRSLIYLGHSFLEIGQFLVLRGELYREIV